MTDLPIEQAAGGVIWRARGHEVEVLLVHRPAHGDWTLPKGKLETHESLAECARREAIEETGVRPVIGRYLGYISYYKQIGQPKEAHYWAMQAQDIDFRPSAEVDEIRWVDEQSLTDRVSYGTERRFIAGLDKGWRAPADRILLTRHAEAGGRADWQGDDSDRPLTERGESQAKAIVGQLEGFHFDSIITSRAARCVQTVAPLARARKLVPEVSGELWEEAGVADVESLLEGLFGGSSLLCSHRPNVLIILRKLMGDRADLPPDKGSTWMFDFDGKRLVSANYLAAPA